MASLSPRHGMRYLASHEFENGAVLEIRVIGDLSTQEALRWADELLAIKKAEVGYETLKTRQAGE